MRILDRLLGRYTTSRSRKISSIQDSSRIITIPPSVWRESNKRLRRRRGFLSRVKEWLSQPVERDLERARDWLNQPVERDIAWLRRVMVTYIVHANGDITIRIKRRRRGKR